MSLWRFLIYGSTGSGKTTGIGDLAERVWREQHKRTRLYSADGGEWPTIQYLVDGGIIEPWAMNGRDFPFETGNRAARGWWPDDPLDPTSALKPPTPDVYERFGLFAYEGLSTMSDWAMGGYVKGGLADRAARGDFQAKSEDAPVTFTDGALKIGSNPKSHYNIIQVWAEGLTVLSHRHPLHVVWTSHQTRISAKPEQDRESCIGPEVTGSAVTHHVPRWFSAAIHIHMRSRKGEKGELQTERRFYIKPHYDPDKPTIPYLAKPGISHKYEKLGLGKVPEHVTDLDSYLDLVQTVNEALKTKGVHE